MKRVLTICLAFCCSLLVNAQATDLVIDNQAPGWLSSKINYGDQQTVKNLKVTGYINKTDLNFIGTLTQLSLNGIIDLSEATIVENTWNGSFKILSKSWESDYSYHLQKLVMPKNLKAYCEPEGEVTGVGNTEVDTLVFDTNIKVIKGYDSAHRNNRTDTKRTFERKIGHLIIGENTDSILNVGRAESVHFPRSLKYLENYSCWGRTDFSKWNISEFPNLRFMGYCAFTYNSFGGGQSSFSNQTLPDTISLPKIKTFCMTSFDYKEGMHIFFGDQLENLTNDDGVAWSYPFHSTIRNVSFHIKRIPRTGGFYGCDSSVKVYVPKGTKQEWINAGYTKVTIIEEAQPLEKIEISLHEISLEVNETFSLTASPVPANADDVNIIWNSDEPEVCTVNEEGLIKAIRPGVSNIIAMSSDGLIRDTCKVTVKAHAESISLSTNSVVLTKIGESQKIEVTILPENAVDKSVIWKSSNEQVCSVSQEGVIVATGVGSTIVTATTVDGGHTANCVVKVLQHVTGLSFEKNSISLKVGEKEQLKVEVKPDNADDKTVTWSSSNKQIASVDANGNVTALKAGEAWIKAVSVDNAEAKDSCKVTVTQPVTGVLLSKENYTFDKTGESVQLTATVQPEDASNKEVRWSSSNENVCIVQNGLVTAVASGTATITVTTVDGNFTANCIVKVVQHVAKVEMNKTSLTLKVGDEDRLTASVAPDNAENKALTWMSSNEKIATVDANGNVKALKAGEAWIKAVSIDNVEAKDSCKVTVTQPVTGITISQEAIKLTNIGENKQLEATVLPEDASNKEVKWKSSNESICMVANGKVIATGFGTSVVMVTTVDGGFMASCTVTVESENTSIESVDVSVSDNPVYNMMGRKVTVLEKGRLYIRNGKKFIAK